MSQNNLEINISQSDNYESSISTEFIDESLTETPQLNNQFKEEPEFHDYDVCLVNMFWRDKLQGFQKEVWQKILNMFERHRVCSMFRQTIQSICPDMSDALDILITKGYLKEVYLFQGKRVLSLVGNSVFKNLQSDENFQSKFSRRIGKSERIGNIQKIE